MRWAAAAAAGVLVAVPGAVAVYAQQPIAERTTEFAFSNPNLTVTAGEPVRITLTNGGMFPHMIAFADEAGARITVEDMSLSLERLGS